MKLIFVNLCAFFFAFISIFKIEPVDVNNDLDVNVASLSTYDSDLPIDIQTNLNNYNNNWNLSKIFNSVYYLDVDLTVIFNDNYEVSDCYEYENINNWFDSMFSIDFSYVINDSLEQTLEYNNKSYSDIKSIKYILGFGQDYSVPLASNFVFDTNQYIEFNYIDNGFIDSIVVYDDDIKKYNDNIYYWEKGSEYYTFDNIEIVLNLKNDINFDEFNGDYISLTDLNAKSLYESIYNNGYHDGLNDTTNNQLNYNNGFQDGLNDFDNNLNNYNNGYQDGLNDTINNQSNYDKGYNQALLDSMYWLNEFNTTIIDIKELGSNYSAKANNFLIMPIEYKTGLYSSANFKTLINDFASYIATFENITEQELELELSFNSPIVFNNDISFTTNDITGFTFISETKNEYYYDFVSTSEGAKDYYHDFTTLTEPYLFMNKSIVGVKIRFINTIYSTTPSGSISFSPDLYNEGYSHGYDIGYSNGNSIGYDNGYDEGYDDGYDGGLNDVGNNQTHFDSGYDFGYQEGFFKGFDEGEIVGESGSNSLGNMVKAVVVAPFDIFRNIFSFDILGFNLGGFVFSCITLLVVLWLIKRLI